MLLFVVLPYVALVVFVLGTIERYRRHSYGCSSYSSQILENRLHFWAVVPFHYGVIVVLLAHLGAFLVPDQVLLWNSRPLRLYLLEATGLAFGLLATIGLLLVIARRTRQPHVRAVTSVFDYVVYGLLLVQLAGGVLIAMRYTWGSSWYAAVAVPYLRSLLTLTPDPALVSSLPLAIRIHIAGAFLLIALFPFSRLVHVVDVPNAYLWRRPQVVRWYRRRPVLVLNEKWQYVGRAFRPAGRRDVNGRAEALPYVLK